MRTKETGHQRKACPLSAGLLASLLLNFCLDDFDKKFINHFPHLPFVWFIIEVMYMFPCKSCIFLSRDVHDSFTVCSCVFYCLVLSSLSLLMRVLWFSTSWLAFVNSFGIFCSYMQKLGKVNLRWLWGTPLVLMLLTTWFSPVRLLGLLQGNADYWQLSCRSRCHMILIFLRTKRDRISKCS